MFTALNWFISVNGLLLDTKTIGPFAAACCVYHLFIHVPYLLLNTLSLKQQNKRSVLFRKICFERFTSGSGFSSFDFAGLVSVKIKNTLNYWFGSGSQKQKFKGSNSVRTSGSRI